MSPTFDPRKVVKTDRLVRKVNLMCNVTYKVKCDWLSAAACCVHNVIKVISAGLSQLDQFKFDLCTKTNVT